jgi:hypothetical protein
MYSDMATAPKSKGKADHDIELLPDAWPRFERMVRAISKAGPQHREAPPPQTKVKKAAKTAKKRGRNKG